MPGRVRLIWWVSSALWPSVSSGVSRKSRRLAVPPVCCRLRFLSQPPHGRLTVEASEPHEHREAGAPTGRILRLLAVAGRHRRPRREKIDAQQRRELEPARALVAVEKFGRQDRHRFALRHLDRLLDELLRLAKRGIEKEV